MEDEEGEEEEVGAGTTLQHQHRWKSFVSQQEDWLTVSILQSRGGALLSPQDTTDEVTAILT